MARWTELKTDVLPPELQVFDPRKWLLPGEDPTDPIPCHIMALSRYRDAVRAATGADPHVVAAAVTAGWYGPVATRARVECPCRQCGRSEETTSAD
jgi:hypothetical protein